MPEILPVAVILESSPGVSRRITRESCDFSRVEVSMKRKHTEYKRKMPTSTIADSRITILQKNNDTASQSRVY